MRAVGASVDTTGFASSVRLQPVSIKNIKQCKSRIIATLYEHSNVQARIMPNNIYMPEKGLLVY